MSVHSPVHSLVHPWPGQPEGSSILDGRERSTFLGARRLSLSALLWNREMKSSMRKDKPTRRVRVPSSPQEWPAPGERSCSVSRDAVAMPCSEWDLARSQQILQIGISKITDGIVFSEIFEGEYSSASRVNAVRASTAAVGLGHHFILFQCLIILGFSTPTYYCSG